MKLQNIIAILCQYDPEETVCLQNVDGEATDQVGYLIYNLVTEQDIFKQQEFKDVRIKRTLGVADDT